MPTRTIAYLRVSTNKQADRGVSLDAQRAKVKAYAELYDLELIELIVDAGESAKSLERPGLQRALGMLKRSEAGVPLEVNDGSCHDHRLRRSSRALPFPPPRPHERLLERGRQGDARVLRAQRVASRAWGCPRRLRFMAQAAYSATGGRQRHGPPQSRRAQPHVRRASRYGQELWIEADQAATFPG